MKQQGDGVRKSGKTEAKQGKPKASKQKKKNDRKHAAVKENGAAVRSARNDGAKHADAKQNAAGKGNVRVRGAKGHAAQVSSARGNAAKKGYDVRAGKGGGRSGMSGAPARVQEPLCPVSAKCGGCSRIDVPYAAQLAEKQQFIAQLFEDVVPHDAIIEPVRGMSDPYHYRAKVASPFAPGRKLPNDDKRAGGRALEGKGARAEGRTRGRADARAGVSRPGSLRAPAPRREILIGMYAAHSHRLVPTDECLLENKKAKSVILAIRSLMYRFNMEPYNEDTGVGFVRHAVVRVGHKSGEVLVTLVTNAREFPASRSFCRELVKLCPFVTTVVQNVNLRQTNVILGEEERTLYGPGFILDTLCGLSFRVSSRSFYQVNSVQTEVLYKCAIDMAHLTGKETVIDAYCGTGTIGLVAAKNGAARVIGVDSVASAIRDARQNARHNGVENAEFVVGDAGSFMCEFAAENAGAQGGVATAGGRAGVYAGDDSATSASMQGDVSAGAQGGAFADASAGACASDRADASAGAFANNNTVLFLDPPRAGASEEFLDAACVLSPSRIVYISCNPETQARDVAYLARAGYEVRKIQPVDMFPHTDHIECIAMLTKTRD